MDQLLEAPLPVTRLSFRLPDTVRLAWVSDEVRALREPMLGKLKRMWAELEVRTVTAGLRRCALRQITAEDFEALAADSKQSGLKAETLRIEQRSGLPGSAAMLLQVAVGKKRDVRELKAAWVRGDYDAIGDLLGYPTCCRAFYRRIFIEERLSDPVWAMAQSSQFARRNTDSITISGPPLLNLLLRSIGVRAVPHFPCSIDCPDSVAFANRWMSLARSLGFADEAAQIEEMLAWPVEWSALHGIAEIRTPIVKITTQTDATASKLTLRWIAESYPPDGARGLAFPFKPLQR